MNSTITPAPQSSVAIRFDLPPEQLARAVDEAVRHLARRTRIPGFRPGKAPRAVVERAVGAPAILEEALDHLVQRAYRDALAEHDITPLTNADIEIEQGEEGKPVIFTATVQVRPEVRLGDYRGFNFSPEIEVIDDAKINKVIEELADQNATLAPVEDRGATEGDYAVIGYVGTRDGVPFEGGSAERLPLILGQERLIPGFEANLMGLRPSESTAFDIAFPDDYAEASLAGQTAHFAVDMRELREKVLPAIDDEFARSMGAFEDLAGLRVEIEARLKRNALDRARHEFSDRIIEYAVANATLELPDILVDQEVEVMHDEFRGSLARQGITEEAYLKVVEKSDADLHTEFRPNAEKRVRVLLVLSRLAETEGVVISDADVNAEVARARERYAGDKKTITYFESARGRSFVRSTLRRSRVVEQLVDAWLAGHPDHPALPHLEDDVPGGATPGAGAASAPIDTTPGASAANVAIETTELDPVVESDATPATAG